MLRCRDMTELVTSYLEGRVSFADRVRFQLHLGMCGNCREYVRQMKLTIRSMGMLPTPALSPTTRDELLRRFRGWLQ